MQPIVSLRAVTAGYEGRVQLRDASLSVGDRDFVGIVGPNGGGKTTLLRIVLGLLRPMAGRVDYATSANGGQPPRMGYLPQYNAIDRDFPISALDAVVTGFAAATTPFAHNARRHRELAAEALASVGAADLARRPVGALSGGQLQRVLMARALVGRPELLVLDEPDTYIDAAFREQMHAMLDSLRRRCAILMVSHDTDYLLKAADRVYEVNVTVRPLGAGQNV